MHGPSSNPSESRSAVSGTLYDQIYGELRRLAHAQMSKEYMYSTLQGTALVHEAWLRLGGENQADWKSQRHLLAAASEAMRRILVERARKRSRIKYGGKLMRADEDEMLTVSTEIKLDDQLIRVSESLEKFALLDPQKAELVRLRYFFGLSFEEASRSMGISLSTAKRWWNYSRSWLYREMASR